MKSRLLRFARNDGRFILVTLVGALLLIEGMSAFVVNRLRYHGWIAYIPTLNESQVQEMLDARNRLTGWGPSKGNADPYFEDPITAHPCVSTYGESFTEGRGPGDSYPYFLEEQIGCEVNNYGVGGWGTDQIYMFYHAQRTQDPARKKILGYLTENILRNVNQYRNLLYPGSEFGFKPRLHLSQGKLVYVPTPLKEAKDYPDFAKYPEHWLTEDEFTSRPRPAFPYSWTIARWLLGDYHFRATLSGIPRYANYYNPAHPSQALPLTLEILKTFAKEVKLDGGKPYIAIIPTCRDLEFAKKHGRWVEQPLLDLLAQEKIPYFHLGPKMLKLLGDKSPEVIFESVNGHPNPDGYRMMATIVAASLKEEKSAKMAGQLGVP